MLRRDFDKASCFYHRDTETQRFFGVALLSLFNAEAQRRRGFLGGRATSLIATTQWSK